MLFTSSHRGSVGSAQPQGPCRRAPPTSPPLPGPEGVTPPGGALCVMLVCVCLLPCVYLSCCVCMLVDMSVIWGVSVDLRCGPRGLCGLCGGATHHGVDLVAGPLFLSRFSQISHLSSFSFSVASGRTPFASPPFTFTAGQAEGRCPYNVVGWQVSGCPFTSGRTPFTSPPFTFTAGKAVGRCPCNVVGW